MPPPKQTTVTVGGLSILRDAIEAHRKRIPAIIEKALREAMMAPPPMTEDRARALISEADYDLVDSTSHNHKGDARRVQLDGHYTADELEAFAWWLRNKPGETP